MAKPGTTTDIVNIYLLLRRDSSILCDRDTEILRLQDKDLLGWNPHLSNKPLTMPGTTAFGSFVAITSLEDGHVQVLDGRNVPEWRNSTAYFNDEAVRVELYIAPRERGIFARLSALTVGDWVGGRGSFCGLPDNRWANNERRLGRIVPGGCTAWIASNGAYLSAGSRNHYGTRGDEPQMHILQFAVPDSNSDGTIRNPSPEHQYPIIADSFEWRDGLGNDWGFFNSGRNTNGLLPTQAYGAFFRLSRDRTPRKIGVMGYGRSMGSRNRTQQYGVGPNLGETMGDDNCQSVLCLAFAEKGLEEKGD